MDEDYGWPEGIHKCIACGFAGTTEDKNDKYFGYRTAFGFVCRRHVNPPDRITLAVSAATKKPPTIDPLVQRAVESAIKKFNRREMEREMGIFTEDVWEVDVSSPANGPNPFKVTIKEKE